MPLFTTQPADRTASTALGYRADVKLGGKAKDRFLPSMNTSFGRSRNDEFFINVRADDKVKITGQEKIILADDLTEIETPGRHQAGPAGPANVRRLAAQNNLAGL